MKLTECKATTCCLVDVKCGGPKLMSTKGCQDSICCQIGDNWILYPDRNQCSRDQQTRAKESYVTCYVSFPCTGYSYSIMTSTEECEKTKSNALVSCNGEIECK